MRFAVCLFSLVVRGRGLAAYLVSAGTGLVDDPAALAKQSAEAARHLMEHQGEARAIAP